MSLIIHQTPPDAQIVLAVTPEMIVEIPQKEVIRRIFHCSYGELESRIKSGLPFHPRGRGIWFTPLEIMMWQMRHARSSAAAAKPVLLSDDAYRAAGRELING